MDKQVVVSEKVPKPVAVYSQAVKAGGFVFTAGQVAIDPNTGKLVAGDIEAQTRRTLENLKAALEAAGSSLDNVVKTTVFLKNLDRDYQAMNKVYGEYFRENPPARSTVEVSKVVGDLLVEVEAIAIIPDGGGDATLEEG